MNVRIVTLTGQGRSTLVVAYAQEFPTAQSPEVQLAELMVEAVMGEGNADMLPDGDPCTCGVGDADDMVDGKPWPRIHHTDCAGGASRSAALQPSPPVSDWSERYGADLRTFPVLRNLLVDKPKDGVDGVYDWADLKAAEADGLAMHHTGFQLAAIAVKLARQESAVRQLIRTGAWKLDRALQLMAPLPIAAHCEICQEARDSLFAGLRPDSRTA